MDFKSLFKCCFPNKKEDSKETKVEQKIESIISPDVPNTKTSFSFNQKFKNQSSNEQEPVTPFEHNIPSFYEHDAKPIVEVKKKSSGRSGHFRNESAVSFKSFTNNVPGTHNRSSSNSLSLSRSKKYSDTSFDINCSQRVIGEEIVKIAPLLCLEETEGNLMKDDKLMINASGLVEGARKAKDGVTFFGKNLKCGDIVVNDYVLNIDNTDYQLNHIFFIYYRKESNQYFLRSYKEKNVQNQSYPIVLVRLDKQYPLSKKQIVKIGDIYFQVTPGDDSIEIQEIDAKSPQNKKKHKFRIQDSPLTIGRNKQCNVAFPDDKSFSRVHCNIVYDISFKMWIVRDGQDRPSTNGTWLYAQHSYEIQNGTVFRVHNSVFKLTIKEHI
jgi:hypothetical protein